MIPEEMESPKKSGDYCKYVNPSSTHEVFMSAAECSTKRIPVRPRTWEELYELRKPGQTFDQVLSDMVAHEKKRRLFEDADRKMRDGHFTELE